MNSEIDWIAEFERHLLEKGFAKATIASYVAEVRVFSRTWAKNQRTSALHGSTSRTINGRW